MKDIIEQIIEIDSLAFENKKKNEEYLKNKRQEYENKIIQYRESMLENAKTESEKILSQISEINIDKPLGDSQGIEAKIESKYSQIEDEMVKIIFDRLFAMDEKHTMDAAHSTDDLHPMEN